MLTHGVLPLALGREQIGEVEVAGLAVGVEGGRAAVGSARTWQTTAGSLRDRMVVEEVGEEPGADRRRVFAHPEVANYSTGFALQNAKDFVRATILKGGSWGIDITLPPVGAQCTGNGSGILGGAIMGAPPSASGSWTYGFHFLVPPISLDEQR